VSPDEHPSLTYTFSVHPPIGRPPDSVPSPTRDESATTQASPDTILAERFARGEIDDREYAHKREMLRSDDPGAHDAGIEDTSHEREVETVAH
jgi:hypothetical protein